MTTDLALLLIFISLIDVRLCLDSGEAPPCPLVGGQAHHVNYRRQCRPGGPKEECGVPPGGDGPQTPGFEPESQEQAFPKPTGGGFEVPDGLAPPGGRTSSRLKKPGQTYRRTTPYILSFLDDCDYVAYYCMKTYTTGKICGRTYYNIYYTFPTYCLLDYVNCCERWDTWHIAYMGECKTIKKGDFYQHYKHYPYENDYFMDQYYVIEYGHPGK